jgi:serine/threonine-protein kinase RsbW
MTNPSATSSRRLELRVASHPANLAGVRKAIEAFAADHGFDERETAEIGLCVNEAEANIIRHAYNGDPDRPVHIAVGIDGDVLTITLRDWGNGLDPSLQPTRPYNPLEPGGVGLICLRQWMDSIVYTPQPDGMLTTMKRRKRR